MAIVSKNISAQLPTAWIDDCRRPLVFVVDMVNGFVKDGALADISIRAITPNIKGLLAQVKDSVFICDSHNLDAREFESYPIHCIENTEEAMVIDELKPYVQTIVHKNSTNAFVAQEFQDHLESYLLQFDDYIIVGCCSDICILQFASTFQTFLNENNIDQKRIIVPINMIETFHIDDVHEQQEMNDVACKLMLASGVQLVKMG